MIHPSSLEDHSSTLPTLSSTSDQDKSTSHSQHKRYDAISIAIQLMSRQRRYVPKGDVDQPYTEGINSQRIKKKDKLRTMNPLHQRQVHNLNRYGRKRWHHHQSHHHNTCNYQGLYLWDRLMHLKSNLDWRSPVRRTQNSESSLGGKIGGYPYLLLQLA